MNATPAPRGFTIDRSDGRPPLPGSLHTNRRLSTWLSLAEPGVVRVFTGKAELGQGIHAALQMIVADELDVPLQAVRVLGASTTRGPDEGMTSGSLSVQDGGGALRQASAELRALALQRAAARSGLGAAQLHVEAGQVLDAAGELLGSYWSLLGDADLDIECDGQARPKAPEARRLIGRARPVRADLADKVLGRPRFIHDLRPPGLLHARVLRPPTLQATLAEPPAGLSLPEGVRLHVDGRFIAVLAKQERDAEAVAARVQAQLAWQAGAPLPDAAALADFLCTAPHDTTVPVQKGEAAMPPGGVQREAAYFKPYLAHASIGPSCALARFDGDRLEVWTHSQGIHNLRDDLVLALGLPREAIDVHHVEGAGCYGHNGADDVAFDAVLLALAHRGEPVRVQWTRADELAHSPLGPAQRVAVRARLDDAGRITHWHTEVWAQGFSSRPGRAKVPTLLAASQRAEASALPLPINPPLGSGGGAERNGVPGYAFANVTLTSHRLTVMPLRTSAMRALGAYANVFAIESFMDELARERGEDPLAFRRRHLDDPRALAVLDAAVSRSAWWAARQAEPEGRGHGLAWARYKNTGAWCAALARVEVTDQVRVLDLELAVDVGMVVDADGVINQIEGGALQSLSWTLKEQVIFDAGGVTSTSWDRYPVLRFSEVPRLRVHLIDRPEQPPLGAGEAAQGPVAAAIANAVHDALGVRVRALPLTPEQLLRVVHAAEAA